MFSILRVRPTLRLSCKRGDHLGHVFVTKTVIQSVRGSTFPNVVFLLSTPLHSIIKEDGRSDD